MIKNLLILICLGFFSGVFIGSFFDFNFYTFLFILFLLGLLIWRFKFFQKNNFKFFIFFSLIILGFGRIELAEYFFRNQSFLPKETSQVFSGLVYREPDRRTDKTLVYLQIQDEKSEKTEKVLLFASIYPEIEIGDKIEFRGEFVLPESFESEGRIFDYPGFLKKDGVSLIMYRPRILKIDENVCCRLKREIVGFKNDFENKINTLIRSPESELLNGILLGDKRAGGPEWAEKFRQTGLIHIMVLSGYNLSLVSDFVLKFLGFFTFFPSYLILLATLVALLIFIIAVGGSATILRAGIMAIIAILARFLGRKYDVRNALFVAGFLMVLWSPFILVYDPAFQLSFLATFGLIYLAPILEVKFARFYPGRFTALKNIIATTIMVQLFVTPHLLYLTGNLPIFSLPANILVLPLVPLVMFFGALSGALAFISEIFAWPIAIFNQFLLSIILKIVDFLAYLTPEIKIPAFSFWITVFVYLGFGYFIWYFKQHKRI